MSNKSENAKNLYLLGIREGKVGVVKEYTGDRYTQHSTGVKDGADGFIEFFKGFIERTTVRDIRVIRIIEDGRYVFTHVYQDIDHGSAKWVTADLFYTDENDKIVEHWDVIAPYIERGETASGNDMILGDFQLKDLDKTEKNKALVRSFLVDVFQIRNLYKIESYISSAKYIQHSPVIPAGIDGLKQFLANLDFSYDFVFHVMGQGDHVVSYSKVTFDGKEYAMFDIFRIDDGKIVEQWNNYELIPPRSEWVNSGKF